MKDDTSLFVRWANFPLLGSLFEGEKKSASQDDIPLGDLHMSEEEWTLTAGELDDDTPPLTPALSFNSLGKLPERPLTPDDDDDEWYGLEYTLELSSRERHTSESRSETSAGECSRSRESWEAIKPRSAGEQSYLEWCDWRAYMDYRKAYDFCETSRKSSDAYLREMWDWDCFYWELHHNGVVGRALKERLRNAPSDPYYPRHKKNFTWYLKRSRSVASLRELAPIPALE